MLFLLSPAKSLDYETPVTAQVAATTPQFVADSAELMKLLKIQSTADIAALMNLSESLAALNTGRYRAWRPRFTARNSRPAIFAFNGDVYGGLNAHSMDDADLEWAQQHLVILSGLYGILRPLDRLQPYRLEMSIALRNSRGKNLYEFWGDTLAKHVSRKARTAPSPIIVNLASQEYFKAVDRKALKPRVIECVFEDWKNGQYKVISFFAKRARGLMARHAITMRATQPEDLQAFAAEAYAFDASASQESRFVFRRRVE